MEPCYPLRVSAAAMLLCCLAAAARGAPSTAAPATSTPAAPATPATTPAAPSEAAEAGAEESGRAAAGGDRMLRALTDRLYESCVLKDSLSCLGLKVFYAAARFTEAPDTLATVRSERAARREAEADRVLVDSAASMLKDSLRTARQVLAEEKGDGENQDIQGLDAADATAQPVGQGSRTTDDFDEDFEENSVGDARRRRIHMLRKMMLPLMVGVVLKLASLIPLVLGKLALLGTVSLMASKMSLVILVLMTLRRWLGAVDHHPPIVPPPDAHSYYTQHHPAAASPAAYAHAYDAHAYEAQGHPALAAPPADYAHGAVHPLHPAATVHPLHTPFRRVYRTYQVVRGRQLGSDADWAPTEPVDRSSTVPTASQETEQSTQIQDPLTESPSALATEAPAAPAAPAGPAHPAPTAATAVDRKGELASSTSDEKSSTSDEKSSTSDDKSSTSDEKLSTSDEKATSGFSVSQESVESKVRRLDEVEGRIAAR